MIEAIFSGAPTNKPFPAGSRTVTDGIDTFTGCRWVNLGAGSGWQPGTVAFYKNVQLALTGEAASQVVVAPVTGLYRIDAYLFPTVIASNDDGTLPSAVVAYTESDSAVALTGQVIVADVTSLTTQAASEGSTLVNVKAGGSITVTTASYAAGTGTGVTTYNIKTRISYVG